MRFNRLVPALAAGALTLAAVSPAHAQTEPEPVPGVATTTGSLTVLSVDAGSLLSLDLLTDTASANTDERVGVPSALAQISALTIESPAAGISQTVPVLSAESTGGTDDKSQAVEPIDSPVLSATVLPVTLQAIVSELSAASNVGAGLADVDVLGGIVALDAVSVGLGEVAQGVNGDGLRGVDVDALTVLDLEALLEGLGIPLASLPLDTLLALVDSLGLPLDTADLAATIDGLTSTLDNIAESVGLAGVSELLAAAEDGSLEGLLDTEGATEDAATIITTTGCTVSELLPICGGAAQSVEDILAGDVVDAVLGLVGDLDTALNAPLDVLAGQALVSLEGLDVSIVTTATDSLETSVASITGTLGTLTVGGLPLGELDLLATADQVNAVLGQAQTAIGDVLGTVDPSLADLVDIQTLIQATDVVQDADGAVTSTASFTGLQIDVTPDLEALLAFVQSLAGVESVADTLGGLGLAVPAGVPEISQLNGLLAGVPTSGIFDDDAVFALTEGLSVQVAGIQQTSAFTPGAATPAEPVVPALPTTGSNDTTILLLGGALGLAALAARRYLARVN